MNLYPGAHFDNFSWPSLYSPVKDVGFLAPPIRPGGYYLTDADDIFKFILYWSLIFHLPFNFIAGICAFFNLSFPPARKAGATIALGSLWHAHSRSQSQSKSQPQSHSHLPPLDNGVAEDEGDNDDNDEWLTHLRTNARRSRLTFSLLVLVAFLLFSLLRAVLGAAVLAGVLFGLYRAGGFYMSTWIPFVWAVIQSLFGLLEIWPSIIDII